MCPVVKGINRFRFYRPDMSSRYRLTSVETVHDEGFWLFTSRDEPGAREEVVLVPCESGVEAWVNRCTHEDQRLHRRGTARRSATRGSSVSSRVRVLPAS